MTWRIVAASSSAVRGNVCRLPALACAVRWAAFQSKEFYAATKEVPLTPGGKNPYELFEMPITKATTLDDIAKQKRELVQKYHPDAPGGSTEKMAEINAAHSIVKEHHGTVVKKFSEVEVSAKANEAYRQHKTSRTQRDEELGRNGGVSRKNVRSMNQQSGAGRTRSQKEIEVQWETYRAETDAAVLSMCRRYELAVEQGKFFRKSAILSEITVRERWLRKSFIKGVWEDVHELRGELLRKGARNVQQSQLAEEMVAFAGAVQKKLNEDFSRMAQGCASTQSLMFMQRTAISLLVLLAIVKGVKSFCSMWFHGSLTARLRPAMLGY